jgi:outer membrane protein assembly factor BamB
MPSSSRRRLLKLCSVAAVTAVAGCGGTDPAAETVVTDTATPTDGTTPTTTTAPDTDTETTNAQVESPVNRAWTVDRLSGSVDRLLLPAAGPSDEPSGPLYAATEAGEVARIGPVDGEHRWTTTVRGEAEATPSLFVGPKSLYAVSETITDDRLANHVQALDPATGEVRWTVDQRAFLRVIGTVGDRVVLAGEHIDDHPEEIGPNRSPRGDGRVVAVDRATGEERWRVDVPELRGTDVAEHGVYALETRDHETNQLALHAVDPDGTERWTVDTGTINPGSPLATDDLLLAGASEDDATDRGGVGRYDPDDGSLLWTTGQWERGPGTVEQMGDTIFAGGVPLLAIGRDGTERYSVSFFGDPHRRATPETLYNDGGGQLPALDRASGTVRWRYRPENYEYTHLRAVLADHVAVDRGIGSDREIVLLGEGNGEVVGTFRTSQPYHGAVGAGRRLFLGVGADVVAYDLTVGPE